MSDHTDDYGDFVVEIADQVESFLVALREIARGADPDSTLSLLLLEVSQLLLAGGRLGARGLHADVVLKVARAEGPRDAELPADNAALRRHVERVAGAPEAALAAEVAEDRSGG